MSTLYEKLDSYECALILEALTEANNCRKVAAEKLGISRTGLIMKMKKFGIFEEYPSPHYYKQKRLLDQPPAGV